MTFREAMCFQYKTHRVINLTENNFNPLKISNQKRTVKVIFNNDNFCLIKALVIAIAYKERIKERHNILQRPTKLVAEVNKAAVACNIVNRCVAINDLINLENYFVKYRIILLGENYIDIEKVLYANPDYAKFEKNIYIIHDSDLFNVIDSIKAFCGKYYFCQECVDIFSYACDHYICPIKNTVTTTAIHARV